MTMGCGYCGALYKDTQPHYCAQGRDFLVAENKRLREALVRCHQWFWRWNHASGDPEMPSPEALETMCEEALKL